MLVRLSPVKSSSPVKASSPTRRALTLNFKLEVTNKAYPTSGEKVSLRQVAREYNVQPQQIRRWKKLLDAINKSLLAPTKTESEKWMKKYSSHSRFPGAGRPSNFKTSTVDRLKMFYDSKRSNNESVSMLQLRNEVRRIDPESLEGLEENALRIRIWRLLRTWSASWRRATHKAQLTRHSLAIINDFREYVKNKAKMLGCKAENIYNADQTNVYFSLESVYTYAACGSKTVSVKSVDSNQRCTVMLSASLTGEKVIPYIVYKGKNTRGGLVKKEINQRVGYPEDVELAVQENAWFDQEIMLDWIEKVWKREVAVDPNEVYYLLLDSFQTHMTRQVRKEFEKCNTEVDFIPPGYTSKLQMLDVGVNRPFKIHLRTDFENFVCNNNGQKPERKDVAHWINNAWNKITNSTVTNSWRNVFGYTVCSSEVFDEVFNRLDPLALEDLHLEHLNLY